MDSTIVNGKEYKREFVSFGGPCPFGCKHCYTFIPGYKKDKEKSIELLLRPLNGIQKIDIVYVSGHKENFINPDDGIDLCEQIFSTAQCDILFTTRNCFSNSHIFRLSTLNEKMKQAGHDLFACVSIPALQSYTKIENPSIVPSPDDRMLTLKQLYNAGIFTMLTVRPLFHNRFIPIEEPLEIIDSCSDFSSVVLTSGLVTNSYISNALNYPADQKMKERKEIMKCLNQQDILVEYCDVSEEILAIKDFCSRKGLPLFCEATTDASSISLAAVDYLKSEEIRPYRLM